MKRKILTALITIAMLTLAGVLIKNAYERKTAPTIQEKHEEAQPVTQPTPTPKPDLRIEVVAERLSEEGSPLADKSHVFIDCADDNGVDPFLLVGITSIESSFGKHACEGNPFGWNSCKTRYSSLEASCQSVAEGIATKSYYSRYRQTGRVEDLANVYCPPTAGCQTTHWVATVEAVVTDLQDREFIRIMDDLTKFLPAGKSHEELLKNLEALEERLKTATGPSRETIEILIRANKRGLEQIKK